MNENTNNLQLSDDDTYIDDDDIDEEVESESENESNVGYLDYLNKKLRTKCKLLMDEILSGYKQQREMVKKEEIEEITNEIKFTLSQNIDNEFAKFVWCFVEQNNINLHEKLQTEGVFFLQQMNEAMEQKMINLQNTQTNDNIYNDIQSESESESERYTDHESDEDYTLIVKKTSTKKPSKPVKRKNTHNKNNKKQDLSNMDNWSQSQKRAFENRMKNPTEFFYRFSASCLKKNDKKQIKKLQPTKTGAWDIKEQRIFMKNVRNLGVNDQWGLFSRNICGRHGYTASNRWKKLVKNGSVKDLNYYFDEKKKKLCFKKSSKNCKIPREHKKFAITIIKDPSGVWKNLPEKHPQHPSIDICKHIDKELGYDKMNNNNNEKSGCKRQREKNNDGKTDKIKPTRKKRKISKNNKYEMESDDEFEMNNNFVIIYENPMPNCIDIMTGKNIIRPAISLYGHVLGYETWTKILRKPESKNICPFTKKKMTRRDLVKLTMENYHEYKDKIINLSKNNVAKIDL